MLYVRFAAATNGQPRILHEPKNTLAPTRYLMLQRQLMPTNWLPRFPAISCVIQQSSSLSGHTWLHSLIHGQLIRSSRQAVPPAVAPPSAACEEAIRAEFAKASISDADTIKVLQRYKPYYNWDIEARLRPALQLWTQAIGSKQLSERLSRSPHMLVHTPDKCGLVYTWLASIGVDADRVQQKAPAVMARQLSDVQATVAAIQNALHLPDSQLTLFFKRHYYSLLCTPQHVLKVLEVISDLLASPMASEFVRSTVARCRRCVFHNSDQVQQRILFFCNEFKGGDHAASTALKNSVYWVSEEIMQERAAELKEMFGWTSDELNRKISAWPNILICKPSTITANIKALQSSGFTSAQALDMCALQPSLMACDWTPACNTQKLQFLSTVLQLSQEDIAARSSLLTYSLETRLGPRSAFMNISARISPDTPILQSGIASWLGKTGSDAAFAAKFDRPPHDPELLYTAAWQQHWLQRWQFLREDMGLFIADIAACRALLFISLHDTLAPRWQFLKQAEDEQADFKAVEHLQALATLTNEQFAKTYNMPGLGYNENLKQH